MKTPSSSRIISADQVTGVKRFKLTDLAEGAGRSAPAPRPQAPAQAPNPYEGNPVWEAGRQHGMRDGFRRGAEAMRQKLENELSERQASVTDTMKSRITALAQAFTAQMSAVEQSVADELVELAIELARQTVRQSLEADRDMLVGVVQEAVEALIDENASFVLQLNPSDMQMFGDALAPLMATRGGNVAADPSVAVGGCRVVSAGADIDATVETRWRRVLASIGREPRADDPLCNG